ncbi:hypothetical protein [Nitrosopumilus sp.]|uniref:hypothetical protein n=1 Tax=Nitrosopumilus sp. TaxID=2024843 RepID=UPI00349FDDF2
MNSILQSLESHDTDKICMIGRLEKREQLGIAMTSSNSDHKNCFFQYHNFDAGRTFSFLILFYFIILKKILEGESFHAHPSSVNYPQLGVYCYE